MFKKKETYIQLSYIIMYLQTLYILLSIGSTFCDFLPVHDGCKYWNILKVYGNEERKKMHCILDQDFQPGLVYTNYKIIPNGTCPIYNRFAKEIDTISCNRTIGICPKDSIPSHSGVTFTGCYDAIRKQTNVIRPTTNVDAHAPPATSDNTALIVVAILLGITICLAVVCCFASFKYRSEVKRYKDMYEALKKEHEEPKYHWSIPLLAQTRSLRDRHETRVSLNTPSIASREHGYFTE